MESTNTLTTQISTDIYDGFKFGTNTTKKSFLAFATKIVALLIPAILAGFFIDKFVKKLYDNNTLGRSALSYIFIQTLLSICFLYLLLNLNNNYTDEFQNTIAGLYFAALFFGIQSNYIVYLQTFLGSF